MQLSDILSLIGFVCEAVLYGVNATLFLVSIVIVAQKRYQTCLTHPVVLLNCVIFLCCTTHFILMFHHFKAYLAKGVVNGFSNLTKYTIGANIIMSITDVLGETILMYRCWLLYNKNTFVIIIPCLAAFGGLACIAGVADIVLAAMPVLFTAPPHSIVPLGLAGYSLPLCNNVLVTGLIVYRIWSSSSLPNSPRIITQSAPFRAMMLVIESGALYLLIQLIYLVLFALDSPAQATVGTMAIQIYGIAPSLIIVGVGLGVSSEHVSHAIVSTWVARRGHPFEATGAQGQVDGPELDMENGPCMKAVTTQNM